MLKRTALAYFDENHTRVADALGITRSAVSQWGAVVPYFAALDLQSKTGGELKVDFNLYERGKPIQPDQAKAA